MPAFTSIALGTALAAGAVSSVVGASKQANAAESAGNAQVQAAREQIQFAKESRTEAVALAKEYGTMSAGEMAGVSRLLSDKETSLTASMKEIDKQQAMLDQVDPVTKQAGSNLYNLLQGKASDMLAPVQAERDRQRKSLEDNLASSMGPGYRVSSAGIEALTRFDQETSNLTAQTQFNAINQATGTFSTLFGQQFGGQSNVAGQVSNAYGRRDLTDQAVLQAEQFARTREANAVTGAFGAGTQMATGALGNMIPVAGAPYGGDMISGQALGQVGGALIGGATQAATSKMLLKDIMAARQPATTDIATLQGTPGMARNYTGGTIPNANA